MEMPVGFGKKLDIGTWSYGLFADFIQGGATSVGAGFGAIAFDPGDFNLQTGRLYGLILTVFVFNGIIKAMSYLAGHPLPSEVKTTVVTTERSPNKSVVVETVVETKDFKDDGHRNQ